VLAVVVQSTLLLVALFSQSGPVHTIPSAQVAQPHLQAVHVVVAPAASYVAPVHVSAVL